MKTLIYVEKPNMANFLFKKFSIEEKTMFHFILNASKEFPNGAMATWCLYVHLFGVIIDMVHMKKADNKEAERLIEIYTETNLSKLFALTRPIHVQDLKEAFDEYLTPEWTVRFKEVLASIKEAEEIIFYADEVAQSHFQLLYDLSDSKAEVSPYISYSLTNEDIEKAWVETL